MEAKFNGSPFDEKTWNKIKAQCEKDHNLKIVWSFFEKLFNGSNKKAIEVFDDYIDFAFTTIKIATGTDIEHEDLPDDIDLPVGTISDNKAMKRFLAKSILKSKDDKTFERLNVIMDNLPERMEERAKLIDKLSPEDSESISGKHPLVALMEKRKI